MSLWLLDEDGTIKLLIIAEINYQCLRAKETNCDYFDRFCDMIQEEWKLPVTQILDIAIMRLFEKCQIMSYF